jgi:hypothetical protein
VPVRQWVLSFPIPLRSLFAVHPELLAPVLQIIHRVIATYLIRQAGVGQVGKYRPVLARRGVPAVKIWCLLNAWQLVQ